MKIQDVLGFQEIYPEIANIKLPLQTVYKLAKISQKLEQEYNFYQSNFNKILDEFALRKEDGSYEVSEDGTSVKLQPDKISECARRIEELQNVTISEPDAYLSIDELGDINLTLTQMNKLMPFIR